MTRCAYCAAWRGRGPLPLAIMWLKDGLQVCNRCGGEGCYQCQRSGVIVVCPGCACREPEYLHKIDGDTFHCDVCSTDFSRSGKVVDTVHRNDA